MQLTTDPFYLDVQPAPAYLPIVSLNQGFCGFDFRPVAPLISAKLSYNISAPQVTYPLFPLFNQDSFTVPGFADCYIKGTYTFQLYDDTNTFVANNDFIAFAALSTGLEIKVKTTSNVLKRKYYLVINGQDPNFWQITQKQATVTINYECGLSPVQFSSSVIMNSVSYDYNVGDSPIYLNAKALFTTALPQFCPISLTLDPGIFNPVDSSFVTLDQAGLLKISTRDNRKAGNY